VRAQVTIVDGPRTQEIVTLAENKGASLIVCATHGRKGISRLALGSVAEAVVRHLRRARSLSSVAEPEVPQEGPRARAVSSRGGPPCFVTAPEKPGFRRARALLDVSSRWPPRSTRRPPSPRPSRGSRSACPCSWSTCAWTRSTPRGSRPSASPRASRSRCSGGPRSGVRSTCHLPRGRARPRSAALRRHLRRGHVVSAAPEADCHGSESAPRADVAPGTREIALIGRPNSGKSSLYNTLTEGHAHVGNFPGITVDVIEAEATLPGGLKALVFDLPRHVHGARLGRPGDRRGRRAHLRRGTPRAPGLSRWPRSSTARSSGSASGSRARSPKRAGPLYVLVTQSDVLTSDGKRVDEKRLEDELGVPVALVSAREKTEQRQDLVALRHARAAPLPGRLSIRRVWPPRSSHASTRRPIRGRRPPRRRGHGADLPAADRDPHGGDGAARRTGYLARGVFLVDRVLRVAGLGGKAFVPMLTAPRVRGAGHRGDAHPARPEGAPHGDPGAPADDLLGAHPHLRAAPRDLSSGFNAVEKSLVFVGSLRRGRGRGPDRLGAPAPHGHPRRALPLASRCRCTAPPRRGRWPARAGNAAVRFLKDVGTTIVAASALLWVLLHVPAPGSGAGAPGPRRWSAAWRPRWAARWSP
jgi:hypothetical protein